MERGTKDTLMEIRRLPQQPSPEPTMPEAPQSPPLANTEAFVPQEPERPAAAANIPPIRPLSRPSMAILEVLDDGRTTGELIRLRGDRFVVGRSEGDLMIPHDLGISGRHLEIVRTVDGSDAHWHVRDLDSRNGTFFAVRDYALEQGQEILLGICRYSFNSGSQRPAMFAAEQPGEGQGGRQATGQWQALSADDLQQVVPALTEIVARGNGRRYLLNKDQQVLGSASECAVLLSSDMFIEPHHARIYRDPHQRWRIENLSAAHGTFLRFGELRVESSCLFQAGEQRFQLWVL